MKPLSTSAAIKVTQQCICSNLRIATRAITLIYDQALRPSGLRTTQFLLLAKISVSAPITIKQLAKKMLMHRTALARNLKLLEKKDLISIAPGHDRRERIIGLNIRGQKSLIRAYPFWQQAQRKVAKLHGRKQLPHFISELSKLTVKLSIS